MRALIRSHWLSLGLVLIPWMLFFLLIVPRLIVDDDQGLTVGHEHLWSDWPLHIGMINLFAHNPVSSWFAHHPMYAHGKFTYSFLTNLISGLLVRSGISVPMAIMLPSLCYLFLLIIGLYTLTFLITRSKKTSVLTVWILFLSSGPGFMQFISDLQNGLTSFWYPIKHYSRLDEYSWYAGNMIVGILLPQRAFLLGIAISVWSLVGLLYGLKRFDGSLKYKVLLVISGAAAGLLCIAHAHSLIAMVVIVGLLTLIKLADWKKILYYAVPAGLLTTTLYFSFIAGGIENSSFMKVLIGFTAKDGVVGWITMWYQIWGVALLTALAGIYLMFRDKLPNAPLLLGFFALFFIANIILFQPIPWDNAKIFYWAYLGVSVTSAYLLVKILNRRTIVRILIAISITSFLTLTGVVELLRYAQVERNSFMIISRQDMILAEKVRNNTPPDAIFLTAPSTNHWVMIWSARPIMLGFIGWVDNFGFQYQTRLQDIQSIYQGADNAKSLLQKYGIAYVIIGDAELNAYSVNEQYFQQHYPVQFSNDHNRVYKIL